MGCLLCRINRFFVYLNPVCAARRSNARRRPPGPADWIRPPLPTRHGPLVAVVGYVFQELHVAASLWLDGAWWQAIHVEPNMAHFEGDFGAASGRGAHNEASLVRAVHEERRITRAEHRGFSDLFVPVPDGGATTESSLRDRSRWVSPLRVEVLQRWFDLSGVQGHLGDPAFSRYLAATLATLRLDEPLLDAFERLLDCYVRLIEAHKPAEALADEASAMRAKLGRARLPERSWETARRLLHETAPRPTPPLNHAEMALLGLERAPQHVIVGLAISRGDELDPVDGVIRRAAFQRAAAHLAVKLGGVLCAQVGDHGVALLADLRGASVRARNRLTDLAARLATLARQFDLRLGVGVLQATQASSLPERYRGALSAAESALSSGQSLVYGDPHPERSVRPLRALRSDPGKSRSLEPDHAALRGIRGSCARSHRPSWSSLEQSSKSDWSASSNRSAKRGSSILGRSIHYSRRSSKSQAMLAQ